MDVQVTPGDELAVHAAAAARLLKLVANERRLLVLCRLSTTGEATVGELARSVGLSQSALSQHLALMREDGLVAYRRDGQTIHYRIADPNAERLLETLRTIFCPGRGLAPSQEAATAKEPKEAPMLKQITPEEAERLVAAGAVLVDVREPYELATERIAGAIALPLSKLAQGEPADLPKGKAPIFLCASGSRTLRYSAALAELAEGDAYGLAGGIMAWKEAGYPTSRGP